MKRKTDINNISQSKNKISFVFSHYLSIAVCFSRSHENFPFFHLFLHLRNFSVFTFLTPSHFRFDALTSKSHYFVRFFFLSHSTNCISFHSFLQFRTLSFTYASSTMFFFRPRNLFSFSLSSIFFHFHFVSANERAAFIWHYHFGFCTLFFVGGFSFACRVRILSVSVVRCPKEENYECI